MSTTFIANKAKIQGKNHGLSPPPLKNVDCIFTRSMCQLLRLHLFPNKPWSPHIFSISNFLDYNLNLHMSINFLVLTKLLSRCFAYSTLNCKKLTPRLMKLTSQPNIISNNQHNVHTTYQTHDCVYFVTILKYCGMTLI